MWNPLAFNAFSAGHFELTLDGVATPSYLKSVDGGFIKGAIADEPIGPENQRIKHTTMLEIEPIGIELGMASARAVLACIEAAWKRLPVQVSGQIMHGNFNLDPQHGLEFFEAVITETTFPTLDGSSKEPAYLKVKLQPERVIPIPIGGLGGKLRGKDGKKQKAWTPAAFRMTLEGCDLSRVNKIESFTIKQGISKLATGASRFPEIVPAKIEFPNIVGSIASAYDKTLQAWYAESIGHEKGKLAQRTGVIDFLATDLRTPLFSIVLFEVGLVSLQTQRSEANQDQIKRTRFELHVGRMELNLAAGGFDI